MQQLWWFPIAWIGGSLAILGSLMTLGSLLLWLAPKQSHQPKKMDDTRSLPSDDWQNHFKLMVFSVAIAVVGLTLLIYFPLPLHSVLTQPLLIVTRIIII